MTKKQKASNKQEKEKHEERERESEGANRENKGDKITVAQPLCALSLKSFPDNHQRPVSAITVESRLKREHSRGNKRSGNINRTPIAPHIRRGLK